MDILSSSRQGDAYDRSCCSYRMDLHLRKYRERDLERLITLDAACFDATFLFDRAAMQEYAESPDAIALVAESANSLIAGFIIAHLKRQTGALTCYVLTLDVATAFRRTGVAGRMMLAAEQHALAAGATRMELDVFTENHAAIAFYESRGYQRRRQRRDFYGAGLHAFFYRKVLSAPVKK